VSLALYMDHNVHSLITQGLRSRGVDVLAAFEDGAATLADPSLLDRASALGRVLFTGDKDFLREAARRQRAGEAFSGVVYAHPRNVPIGKCVDDLEFIAKASDPADLADQMVYLPL
jgi:hypothetical protein